MNVIHRNRLLANTKIVATMKKYSNEMKTKEKALNMDNINPRVKKLEYAVRGPLFLRVVNIDKELKMGVAKPFKNTTRANVGDSHAMGQKPITFIRQVLACVTYPEFIKKSNYPKDVRERAEKILDMCYGGSIGAYPDGIGYEDIRKTVKNYIEERDSYKADLDNIFLTPGASIGIKNCLNLLSKEINGKPTGVMVPIPQYPLYSATLTEYGLEKVGYFLDENRNWGLTSEELKRSLKNGSEHSEVRALVVINPGNPTGQVLTKENIETIIRFAHENSLIIFADEVYQHNVYEGEFHSFKKVMKEMGDPFDKIEVLSFMSTSKGYMGECGIRGGWLEMMNIDEKVKENLENIFSIWVRPNLMGQTVVDCVAKPPKCGEESYELFEKEKFDVLQSLKVRAGMIEELFNKMDGFSCNKVQGAMYAFPSFTLPPKAVQAAKSAGQHPDVFYAFQLLEETGICVVPGSGFGQRDGTYHFRTTILPQIDELKIMVEMFQKFHDRFIKIYS